ncbi:MAG: CapA family protein [Rikenellaceae bacterium]|nr:CapA family protein [Rikenellaceae bacterium]
MRGGWIYGVVMLLVACGGQPTPVLETVVADPPVQRATLLFAGDLMVHTPQLTAARTSEGYDFSPSFTYLKPLIEEADLAVVNLETTLAAKGAYTGYPLFRSPAAMADAMREAGFDVALLANNHCMDYGVRGARETIEALDRVGLKHTGVFLSARERNARPHLYLQVGGISIALLNYTYGTNGMPVVKPAVVNRLDTVRMKEDIRRAKEWMPDCLAVALHWGVEYERKPNRDQRRIAEFLRREGVQLIIGSHPHVVQPIEQDSLGGLIVYSLGNLLSNQHKRYTDGGLMVRVELEKKGDNPLQMNYRPIPVWVDRARQYRLLTREAADTLTSNPAARTFFVDTEALLEKGL